ncbi:hypothetical protein WH7805_01917 [Synechococcus sp. WH 7805]|nr:hypothetical protein WH7805_01917 [Synechococcus sp. WH 7805]
MTVAMGPLGAGILEGIDRRLQSNLFDPGALP